MVTFLSRTMPTLALQEVTVSVDAACDLGITVGVDPSDIGGRWIERETETPGTAKPVVDGSMHWETYGGLSSAGAAYTSVFTGGDAEKQVGFAVRLGRAEGAHLPTD